MKIMTTKITLSVPDDFYEKMDTYKERLNYSDVFRRAVLAEIEKIEEKGLIIKGLEVYLQQGQATPDDKEKTKKEEISRFTGKWGTPNFTNPIDLSEQPHVRLSKKQMVMSRNRAHFLRIKNERNFEEKLHPLSEEVNDKLVQNIQLNYGLGVFEIAAYFKTKGFTIAQKQLSMAEVTEYITDGRANDARSMVREIGHVYYGLFAADKDDVILIADCEIKS
jgi:predicted CopG family antitoxin